MFASNLPDVPKAVASKIKSSNAVLLQRLDTIWSEVSTKSTLTKNDSTHPTDNVIRKLMAMTKREVGTAVSRLSYISPGGKVTPIMDHLTECLQDMQSAMLSQSNSTLEIVKKTKNIMAQDVAGLLQPAIEQMKSLLTEDEQSGGILKSLAASVHTVHSEISSARGIIDDAALALSLNMRICNYYLTEALRTRIESFLQAIGIARGRAETTVLSPTA